MPQPICKKLLAKQAEETKQATATPNFKPGNVVSLKSAKDTLYIVTDKGVAEAFANKWPTVVKPYGSSDYISLFGPTTGSAYGANPSYYFLVAESLQEYIKQQQQIALNLGALPHAD